ncbi:MAG: hypothetical protein NC331_07650 [Lachnospiraceae bacterium]|nr:hypothetical protein [Lachnospiraceae bacterium]MCM1239247.1 hypothetical protein [Lachnospiraceae bacterium]
MKSRVSVPKVTAHISAVLKGVLFTGVSIQIVLGMVWMCRNLSHVPQFEESLFCIQASRTLRCDERTGILYPLFLWMVRRNPYVAYAAQLAVAYAAAWRFLRVFRRGKKWKTIWGSLALMTMPLVMQCHLAILPCSFAASLLLLELALLAEAVKNPEKRTLRGAAKLCLCWLALALLLPEYLYLGAVGVVLFWGCFFRQWRGNRKAACYGLLLAAAFAGMILGINSLTRTEEAYGRVRKTPLMTLTQRITWSSVLKEYGVWAEQIGDSVGEEMIWQTALYADEMDRAFFPAMEQAVADQAITRQQAKEIYIALIETTWRRHRSLVVKEIIWDMLAYGASPVLLQHFLSGNGYDTYSGRNYDLFLEHTPGLSKRYMDYGCWWFAVAAALTAVLQILQPSGSGITEKRAAAKVALCCLTMAGIMALWYTMSGAGMQDYKNTALIGQLWTAWTVLLLGRETVIKPRPAEKAKKEIWGERSERIRKPTA